MATRIGVTIDLRIAETQDLGTIGGMTRMVEDFKAAKEMTVTAVASAKAAHHWVEVNPDGIDNH